MKVKDVAGILLLAGVGIGAVWFLKNRAGAALNAINPANPNNVINNGAKNLVGEQRLANGMDRVFAGVDIINPFNKSDAYAKSVVGNSVGMDLGFDWFDFNFDMPELSLPQWDFDSINPASDKNLVYKGVSAVAGQNNVATAGDHFFGLIDLINPFNKSDSYAKTVYGLDEDSRVLKKPKSRGY